MKTYKQFAEQEGVRRVDFVDGITGEKETMNEILPALVGGAARAVGGAVRAAGSVAKAGAKVAKPVAKKVIKTAKKVVKKTGKVAGAVASSVPSPEVNVTINKKDKQKPQAKKDRDAMGRHESVEEVVKAVLTEKRKETPDEWMKRTGKKPTTVKGGLGSAGKKQVAQFKKKYGAMKSREDELDARDKAERDKNNAEEMAYEMNSYVKTLAQDRYKNLWAEAAKAKEGEDPEPVKGKKTMTGEKQEGVKINPKEAMPSPGPKVGALS